MVASFVSSPSVSSKNISSETSEQILIKGVGEGGWVVSRWACFCLQPSCNFFVAPVSGIGQYRDPVFHLFILPYVHLSTFATTLASTLLFKSVTLKPCNLTKLGTNIKHYQKMWTEQVP